MKKITQTTLVALLISSAVFSQKQTEPVRNPSGGTSLNQASNSQVILLSPADGQSLNSSEGSKPVIFRWTAIVPKPKDVVTYRLKVWQLMQGQSGTEALRSNQWSVYRAMQTSISLRFYMGCRSPEQRRSEFR